MVGFLAVIGRGQLVVLVLLFLLLLPNSSEADEQSASERHGAANKIFMTYPKLFPEERRQSILDGVILIGMTPFEAKLAGGAFFYKIIVDESKWPKNTNPLKVMWAQSIETDKSQIWMTFKNKSQFGGANEEVFGVYFEHGRALTIEKIKD